MPNAGDNERDFWVGITAFGAVLGTGLYALVEHEWWFGAIYTIGGGAGLMWMSPAAKSYLGTQPSKRVLIAAIAAAWLFLAANIGYSVYNKWLAPTYTVSADDIVQAKAQQFTQDQKQIAEAQDAERVATTAKETADRNLDDANRQIAGLQAKLAAAASQPSVSPPAQPQIQPERLSPEDIATKLSIWDSVGARNVNVLEDAYNNMNNAFKRWPGLIDSTEERQQLHNDIVNFTAAYVKASNDLEVLRSEYPQYTDVSSSLSQPHLATLVKASSDFINAVDGSAGDTPASLELKLRPLAGALRREMDATQSWILALHRIADQKHAELSK